MEVVRKIASPKRVPTLILCGEETPVYTHRESRVDSIGQTPNFFSRLHVIETKCVTEFEALDVSGEVRSHNMYTHHESRVDSI